MKTLTAADRKSLIRLAASLPKGDKGRRAILAGLSKVADSDDYPTPTDDHRLIPHGRDETLGLLDGLGKVIGTVERDPDLPTPDSFTPFYTEGWYARLPGGRALNSRPVSRYSAAELLLRKLGIPMDASWS